MFDVFQNVLFGKKKSSTEAEKEKPYSNDFVMIGQASNDQAPLKDTTESNPNDRLFPKNPYGPSFLPDDNPPLTSKKEEKHHPIMPLQDVPFSINSSLYASAKLDQIWQVISQSLASIGSSNPYQEDYDFSLEKSVISETANK